MLGMEHDDALPDEWAILREWLPEDLRGLAVQSGFFVRNSGLHRMRNAGCV